MQDRTALLTTTPEANMAFRRAVEATLPQGWVAPLPGQDPEVSELRRRADGFSNDQLLEKIHHLLYKLKEGPSQQQAMNMLEILIFGQLFHRLKPADPRD